MDIIHVDRLVNALNGVSERLDQLTALNSERADNQMMLLKLLKSMVNNKTKKE